MALQPTQSGGPPDPLGMADQQTNAEIEQFLAEIGEDAAEVLRMMSLAEDWAVDTAPQGLQDRDLVARVTRFTQSLDDPEIAARIRALAPDRELLSFMSMINTPHSMLFLRKVSGIDDDMLNRISALDYTNDPNTQIERHVLFERLMLIARINVIARIFAPERRADILRVLRMHLQGDADPTREQSQ